MRLLLIEDDAAPGGHIGRSPKTAGQVLDHAADAKDGLLLAAGECYDVLVVDRMLPGVDGLTITLCASGNKTPTTPSSNSRTSTPAAARPSTDQPSVVLQLSDVY